jgi:cysteinyl-tRNA synthetase
MDDDFNTAGATSELFELLRLLNRFIDENQLEDSQAREAAQLTSLARAASTLGELGHVLGLFLEKPASPGGDDAGVDKLVQLLIRLRDTCRENGDYAMADRIRDELAEQGISLEDRKGGTGWRFD